MNAGRELTREEINVLIAEKVMKWQFWGNLHEDYDGEYPCFALWDNGMLSVYTNEESGDVSFYFDPCVRIQDAWMVVNAMRAIGFSFEIGETTIFDDDGNHYGWEVYFSDDDNIWHVEADTPEMAICLAAREATNPGEG